LKISHRGQVFRVRAASSDLEFVKELVADTVGRKHTSCDLAVISNDGGKRTLSPEVWQQTLTTESQGRSLDAPIVMRLDVQDVPETVAAETVLSPSQSLDNLGDCIEQEFEFASHQESLDVAGCVNTKHSVTSSAQRLATQLSSGLWSVVSMFRARVNP